MKTMDADVDNKITQGDMQGQGTIPPTFRGTNRTRRPRQVQEPTEEQSFLEKSGPLFAGLATIAFLAWRYRQQR